MDLGGDDGHDDAKAAVMPGHCGFFRCLCWPVYRSCSWSHYVLVVLIPSVQSVLAGGEAAATDNVNPDEATWF